MNGSNLTRVRWGTLVFPISGVVFVVGALTPGIGTNPATDPAGFARASALVGLANTAGLVTLVLLLLGFQALYGFLAGSLGDRLAFGGLVLSTVGATLFAGFLGIIAFAGPVAGSHYLDGQQYAVSIVAESLSPSSLLVLVFGGFSLLSYTIGSILFAIAFWRSGRLSKWTAVLYAIATPLNATPHYIPALWILGGVALFAAGMGIVRRIWSIPPTTTSENRWSKRYKVGESPTG